MRKIRDALRLQAGGLSTPKIAASLGVGQSTVSEYLKRAARAGLVWPMPEALTDAALERQLFQPMGGETRQVQAQPDWPMIHRELRRKNVTLSLLWEEYRATHPEGYGYSRFCELYRRWEGRLATPEPVLCGRPSSSSRRSARRTTCSPRRRGRRPCRTGSAPTAGRSPGSVAGPDGQPQGRRHQGLLPRARREPDLCGDGRPLRHGRGARTPTKAA